MVKKLPSGNNDNNSPSPFLPGAEYYEAQASNINLLIEDLKNQIREELKDELLKLQYLLNEREAEIRRKELLLAQKEKELKEREELLTRRENREKVMQQEAEQIAIDSAIKQKPGVDYIPNPEGLGGIVGSSKSQSTIIDRSKYQGDSIRLDDGSSLEWNDESKEYDLRSLNQGLKFTYFAVEAAYLNDNYINPTYPQFYSQTILGKQVWYERTPKNRKEDGLGPQYQGRVPLDVLRRELNLRVNAAHIRSDGKLEEEVDFTRAYKNWRYTYETGTYFKNANDELYAILDYRESDSRGNAPTYRTDNKPQSPTFGQQKKTTKSERAKWKSNLGSTGKKPKRNDPRQGKTY